MAAYYTALPPGNLHHTLRDGPFAQLVQFMHIPENTLLHCGEGIMAHSGKVYVTTVTVTGGREGHAVSDDGVLDVQLRRPKLNGASDGTTRSNSSPRRGAAAFRVP